VETAWYKNWAAVCNIDCRIPKCYAIEKQGEEILIVLEDLDEVGYPDRKESVTWDEMKACLKWLANFHAVTLGKTPDKLWKVGTYWHLDTRPDELKVLSDENLKKYAGQIDQKLKNVKYKSFVHGDAKLANFCFGKDKNDVAAVDFQYVGGGCGMKDIAYFVGSCLYEEECESYENDILKYYFSELKAALDRINFELNFADLEKEWREMYYVAWTDFHRFLKGWSPGHWKINSYSEKVSQKIINNLKNKR
jgi:aminoglycoside phosphotransferase (APT) family kinase protein